MKTYDLIIIGDGPAGLSAADQAAAMGITFLIIDENPLPGGRIFTQSGLKQSDNIFNTAQKKRLFKKFSSFTRSLKSQTSVIGVFPDNILLLTSGEGTTKVRYKSLIVACGASETGIPFPGWTLPGVMTSGCTQTLLKTQGIFPKKAVLAGTGPLQLILADQLIKRGGKVLALVETGSLPTWLKASTALLGQWKLLKEMGACSLTLARHRVPVYFNSLVSSAHGEKSLQEIKISSLKGSLKKTIKTDSLCIGYGFVPSYEITCSAGAKQTLINDKWGPVRGQDMQTSVEGLFAVGDGAEINGAVMAEYEGAVAAIGTTRFLGKICESEAKKRLSLLYQKIKKEEKLRKQFNQLMKLPGKVFELASDDTVICRCEDITLRDLKTAAKDANSDINELKRLSRVGMGLCRGRTCGTAVGEILSKLTGSPLEKIGFFTPRPPFRPVTIGQLAKNDFKDN